MSLANRIANIKNKILEAEKKAGRKENEVQLIAVSKNFSAQLIREAHGQGLKCFGENYVQEALPKISELADLDIQWHFVGHLQTNKIKSIADKFALIHSVDSDKLALEISKRSMQAQKILIEVNLAGEASKSGCDLEKLPQLIDSIQKHERLVLCGLMFMPPLDQPFAEQQKYFSRAREIRDSFYSKVSHPHSLVELSMGTSHDFEVAIREGATMVRLGTKIFGERKI